jgi:hypothetical protein
MIQTIFSPEEPILRGASNSGFSPNSRLPDYFFLFFCASSGTTYRDEGVDDFVGLCLEAKIVAGLSVENPLLRDEVFYCSE